MVYTSPAGWESRTGDTTAVADAGYTVLWIAHWNVDAPRLPANDWSGNGWTFWQYGNCGSVPGIAGCVDVDWSRTDSFDAVTIPNPDVTPPTATLAPPADLTGPVTVSFSEVVHAVTPENTFVWTPQTGTYPEVALTCRSGAGVVVDCVAGNVRTAVVQPLEPLLLGEAYQAVVNPAVVPVAVVDRSGNPAPTTTQDFAAPTEVEETSPAVAYGWRAVSKAQAFGGSFEVEHRAGASASFAFTGRAVTWYTITGPQGGKAAAWIDGRRVGIFDQYAPVTTFRVPRDVPGLERGPHVLTIRVLGRATPGASDTQVVVDAVEAGGVLVKNPPLEVTWGSVAIRASVRWASGGDGPRAVECRDRVPGIRHHVVHSARSRPGPRRDLGRRAPRADRRQLRARADVRRRAHGVRARGRDPHASDRRPRRGETGGDRRPRLDRSASP